MTGSLTSPLSPLVRGLLLLLVLASLAAPAPATAAPAEDPSKDFPRMPRSCATPEQMIPQKPVVCRLTEQRASRPTVVLWGDSHAWQMIPALRSAAAGRGVNLVAVVMGSCPPMDPRLTRATRSRAPGCARSNDLALRLVRDLHRGPTEVRVVLGGAWQRYRAAYASGDRSTYTGKQAVRLHTQGPRLFRTLGDVGVGVDVIGQVAMVPAGAGPCPEGTTPYACDLPRAEALPDAASTRAWLDRVTAPLKGDLRPIDLNPAFCDADVCHGRDDGVFTWYHDAHLSASRSQRLKTFLARTLTRVL